MENNKILLDSISELANSNFNDSLIQDNKLCFVINDLLYRVRMPTQGEQVLAEHQRNLKQLDYLKQEGCITKAQLVAQLKTNNIVDIEHLEEVRDNLSKELKNLWLTLATKDSSNISKITEYSEKITKIQNALQQIAIDISTYLNPSLESRLEKFYIEYLTCVCTEHNKDGEWKRLWNNYEDFINSDLSISNKAIASLTWLLLNKR
jgi:hypothetical protein